MKYRVGFQVRWRSNSPDSHLTIRELDHEESSAAIRHARRIIRQTFGGSIARARITSVQQYQAKWGAE